MASKVKQLYNRMASGEPVTHLSKRRAEDFWPTTLDAEAMRAAKILRSYFMDGFVVPYRTMSKVREHTIKHSKAILIFHVMRTGLHPSGTSGSGIIVARLPDGSWSPPSAVLIQTADWDFVPEADMYDCMCIINDDESKLMQPVCTLGTDIRTVVGPVGGGDTADKLISERSSSPCWTWVKGKTQWCDTRIDGTVVFEWIGENERFYGIDGVKSAQILKGEVHAPSGPLMEFREVLEACEKQDWSHRKLPSAGSPGEFKVKEPSAQSLKEFEVGRGSRQAE